jgi:protein SCO1
MKPPVHPLQRRERPVAAIFKRCRRANRGVQRLLNTVALAGSLISGSALAAASPVPLEPASANERTFDARGFVRELRADGQSVVIRHEAVSNYMDAMTMPFRVKQPGELKELRAGDEITFRLHVNAAESWIDRIKRAGNTGPHAVGAAGERPLHEPEAVPPTRPLRDYRFTNELGRVVSLGEFRGQALAITFFFTRCPIPDYCPRLSRNFEEASQKLGSLPGAPTNWHFLSVSFDPAYDTPAVLEAYGKTHHYDPARWSFLTGPADQVNELAGLSGVAVEPDGSLFTHNFRTLVIDAAGRLQTTFPFGGNLSDALVGEMLKAAAANTSFVARVRDAP